MRCHHCQSTMQLTDSLVEGHARQSWYHCPLCGARQTVSQPCESLVQRLGHTLRCSADHLGGAGAHWPHGGRH